jgi:polysaccharide export outer membrane protein
MRRALLPAFVAALGIFCGCASGPGTPERFSRYRPDVSTVIGGGSGDQRVVPVTGGVSGTTNVPGAFVRVFRAGDRVAIYLRDIPVPDVIKDVVDENGAVNMPLIGTVRLLGRTTSQTEQMLEKAYIEGGYYKKINVIVVAEEDEYYVSGEVKRPGKYPLTGELRLLQAIAAAGGPTEFARLKRVKIIRNNETLEFDCGKIEKGEAPDPSVKPGDMIKLESKGILGG